MTELTVSEILGAAVAAEVDRLTRHEAVVRADTDVEGVHQARVSTRRLRSELVTFSDAIESPTGAELLAECKWLGGLLGAVRDLDVLYLRIERRRIGHSSSAPVLERLAAERGARYRELIIALDSYRYRRLVERLSAFAGEPALVPGAADKSPADLLMPRVIDSWTAVAEHESKLAWAPRDRELHRLRILARNARYSASVAASFGPPTMDRLARRLAKLQQVLGDLNDASRAIAWLDKAARSRWRLPEAEPPVVPVPEQDAPSAPLREQSPPYAWLRRSDHEPEAGAAPLGAGLETDPSAEPPMDEPEPAPPDPLIAVELLLAAEHTSAAAARAKWRGVFERAAQLGRGLTT